MGWEMLLGLCEFELPLKGSACTLSAEWLRPKNHLAALWEFTVLKVLIQNIQFHNLFLMLVVLLSTDVSTVLFVSVYISTIVQLNDSSWPVQVEKSHGSHSMFL